MAKERGVPFQPGEDTRRGRGPTKGAPNAGRPPEDWKRQCQGLASREEMLKRARSVLENTKHPAWLGAWRFVAEQGYGQASKRIEMAGAADPAALRIVIVDESKDRRGGPG